MASNSFGTIFRITTWGESHGKAVGVVIDGCPSNFSLSTQDIQQEVDRRSPGKSHYTSPRKEKDQIEILSGVFEGKTTGAPISIIIYNEDVDSSTYTSMKDLLRPGHANFTYIKKYGLFDYRGGGRASARETVCRVAAGAVAKKILQQLQIDILAYIKAIGSIEASPSADFQDVRNSVQSSEIFSYCKAAEKEMKTALQEAIQKGDSLGGVVECVIKNIPIGIGDPVYEKLHANLGKAMLSIPACKGFEIGEGFMASQKKGSEMNDPFGIKNNQIYLKSNNSGGVLGGISTGEPVICRAFFKAPSSIKKKQETVCLQEKKEIVFSLSQRSRHDPCVAIRAVPVIEAMASLVVVDAILLQKAVRIFDE